MCDCDKINKTDGFVIAWRCWYDNGTTNPTEFNSQQHSLEDLPDDGFQAMKLWYSDGGSRHLSGSDYYFFVNHEAGTIYGQTNNEKDLKKYNNALVKTGRHIPDGLMKFIDDKMINATKPGNGY